VADQHPSVDAPDQSDVVEAETDAEGAAVDDHAGHESAGPDADSHSEEHPLGPGGYEYHDPADREWTHDPLERSFFGTVGRGYVIGIVVFGLFAFLLARTQAPEWGIGAAIGAGAFVAFFVGVLGGVVLIGLWAMKNEELIRGNETGHDTGPGWVDAGHDGDDEEGHGTEDGHETPAAATTDTAPAEAPAPESASDTTAERAPIAEAEPAPADAGEDAASEPATEGRTRG
jgi:hypothetical protein